jgi:uncharacterized protein
MLSCGAPLACLDVRVHLTYYVYLLREGLAWTAEMAPELEDLQAQHVAYTRHLMASGAALAAGPVMDGSSLHGVSIILTATLDEARALAEADPAVRAGHYAAELHPWMVPAGYLPDPHATPQ